MTILDLSIVFGCNSSVSIENCLSRQGNFQIINLPANYKKKNWINSGLWMSSAVFLIMMMDDQRFQFRNKKYFGSIFIEHKIMV